MLGEMLPVKTMAEARAVLERRSKARLLAEQLVGREAEAVAALEYGVCELERSVTITLPSRELCLHTTPLGLACAVGNTVLVDRLLHRGSCTMSIGGQGEPGWMSLSQDGYHKRLRRSQRAATWRHIMLHTENIQPWEFALLAPTAKPLELLLQHGVQISPGSQVFNRLVGATGWGKPVRWLCERHPDIMRSVDPQIAFCYNNLKLLLWLQGQGVPLQRFFRETFLDVRYVENRRRYREYCQFVHQLMGDSEI